MDLSISRAEHWRCDEVDEKIVSGDQSVLQIKAKLQSDEVRLWAWASDLGKRKSHSRDKEIVTPRYWKDHQYLWFLILTVYLIQRGSFWKHRPKFQNNGIRIFRNREKSVILQSSPRRFQYVPRIESSWIVKSPFTKTRVICVDITGLLGIGDSIISYEKSERHFANSKPRG